MGFSLGASRRTVPALAACPSCFATAGVFIRLRRPHAAAQLPVVGLVCPTCAGFADLEEARQGRPQRVKGRR